MRTKSIVVEKQDIRATVISEVQRLAQANGDAPPSLRVFELETGISRKAWLGVYWARWGDALLEAGFAATPFYQEAITDEVLLERLVEIVRHYRKFPTEAEMMLFRRDEQSFPTHKTFRDRFGGTAGMTRALSDFTQGKPDLADVHQIVASGSEPDPESHSYEEGLVYLIKSGVHHKIGRSSEIERRLKEIRIALPEAATLIHAIRTDDPAGIEIYWHRRFADRRANGEWFKLTNADIAAFKRRKFQ